VTRSSDEHVRVRIHHVLQACPCSGKRDSRAPSLAGSLGPFGGRALSEAASDRGLRVLQNILTSNTLYLKRIQHIDSGTGRCAWTIRVPVLATALTIRVTRCQLHQVLLYHGDRHDDDVALGSQHGRRRATAVQAVCGTTVRSCTTGGLRIGDACARRRGCDVCPQHSPDFELHK
jgi:hypothetical protein